MFEPKILIISKWIQSKKFIILIKEFCSILSSYSISSFTNSIQTIILKYPKFCFASGFSHLIVFCSYKNKHFLKVFKTPRGPGVIFLINKYAIKNEVNTTSFFKPKFSSPVLLLNNFNSNKKNLQIISALVRQLFPDKKTNNCLIGKHSEIILFDLNSLHNEIEVRIYLIQGVSKLIPRYLRKNKKTIDLNFELFVKNNLGNNKITNYNNSSNNYATFIRVIEIGPRFTLETIGFYEEKKKNQNHDY